MDSLPDPKCHHLKKLCDLLENPSDFLTQLSEFNEDIKSAKPGQLLSVLASPSASQVLNEVIDIGLVKELDLVEETEYTIKDFSGCSSKSLIVLEFFNIILNAEGQNCDENGPVTSTVKIIGPKLLHMVCGNIPKNLWTSKQSEKEAKLVLQKLKLFFKADNSNDLLLANISKKCGDFTSSSLSLYGKYLSLVRPHLNKDTWKRNPFAKASFCWLLMHLTFPYLREYLDEVLPLPLNLVDDFNIENKILGVKCLHHIMENVSHEELRWYGRAEVIFEALKHQLYTKHETLIQVLHSALLTLLVTVETQQHSRDANRYDEIFRQIVFDAEMENNLKLRQALTTYLPDFVNVMGISVVRHMKNLISLISSYLQIYDGPKETARINALKILKSVLMNAWPRVPSHAGDIVQLLLRFLYDIGTDRTSTPQKVKEEMTELSRENLLLLKMAAPHITHPALMAIKDTDIIPFVKDIALDVYSKDIPGDFPRNVTASS